MLVGFIFKPLLHTSKRHVPVIFGNILTEAGERQRQWGGKQRKKLLTLIHFTDCISRQSLLLGHLRIAVCPSDADLWKWLTLRHVSVTQLVIHWRLHTHSPNASYCLLLHSTPWASCLVYDLNSYSISLSDIMNNFISNQCGYMTMLKLKTPINSYFLTSLHIFYFSWKTTQWSSRRMWVKPQQHQQRNKWHFL